MSKKVVKSEDHIELANLALNLYGSMLSSNPRGVDDPHLPQKAFRAAARFLADSDRIAAGELDCTPIKPAEQVWVDVEVMVQSKEERWSHVTDRNGRRVVQKMLQDADSFAPNLPLEHPINQRTSERGKEAWREAQAEKIVREQQRIAAETQVG